MKLSGFKFDLPNNLIALHPSENRDDSRMMVVHRDTGKIEHKVFKDIVNYFDEGDVFVGNDTAAAHAANIYGKPAVIFMGPTSKAFGFITDKDFEIMENTELMCRPCHLHGGDKCPIGSFDCMKSLPAKLAAQRILKLTS